MSYDVFQASTGMFGRVIGLLGAGESAGYGLGAKMHNDGNPDYGVFEAFLGKIGGLTLGPDLY